MNFNRNPIIIKERKHTCAVEGTLVELVGSVVLLSSDDGATDVTAAMIKRSAELIAVCIKNERDPTQWENGLCLNN